MEIIATLGYYTICDKVTQQIFEIHPTCILIDNQKYFVSLELVRAIFREIDSIHLEQKKIKKSQEDLQIYFENLQEAVGWQQNEGKNI